MGNYGNGKRHNAGGSLTTAHKMRAAFGRVAGIVLSIVAAGILVAHGPAARAQAPTPNDLISPWLVTVEGESRTRTLRINGVATKADGTYLLDAVYGWSDGALSAIKAEMSQTSGGLKLTLTTQAKSVIAASQLADGSFSGTFTGSNGKVKPIKLVKATESALTAASAPAASAFLKKDELEKLVVGKDLQVRRTRDGAEIQWDIKADGMLYGSNRTTQGTDSAQWTIRDDGALCFAWRGRSTDGCIFFNRQGEKYTLHSAKNKAASYEVTSIK